MARQRLTYVKPLQAGIVLCVVQGIIGVIQALILVPFVAIASVFGGSVITGLTFLGVLLVAPFLIIGGAILGFVMGVVLAAIYNLVAKWTGGLEIDLSDGTPPASRSKSEWAQTGTG